MDGKESINNLISLTRQSGYFESSLPVKALKIILGINTELYFPEKAQILIMLKTEEQHKSITHIF